ncbi:MAG: hypothetical protein DDT35_01145 [Firmicutes bacterium]|nr:hypothetical protein [Bacillota bacterium]
MAGGWHPSLLSARPVVGQVGGHTGADDVDHGAGGSLKVKGQAHGVFVGVVVREVKARVKDPLPQFSGEETRLVLYALAGKGDEAHVADQVRHRQGLENHCVGPRLEVDGVFVEEGFLTGSGERSWDIKLVEMRPCNLGKARSTGAGGHQGGKVYPVGARKAFDAPRVAKGQVPHAVGERPVGQVIGIEGI